MITPKKSLGQNFLIDKNIVKKILKYTKIENENILEIGPGLGILTNEILNYNPKSLTIIEKDKKLYQFLLSKFKNSNTNIINEDVMNYKSTYDNYKIISNLPYNISSKIIMKLLITNQNNLKELICMIQSELADKFDYSKKKFNKYKFLCKFSSNYEILFRVNPNVFHPKPKVISKVVKFKIKKQKINEDKLNFFLKNFFINKRKKIKSNKYFRDLINSNYDDMRYEELSFSEILYLYKTFKFFVS